MTLRFLLLLIVCPHVILAAAAPPDGKDKERLERASSDGQVVIDFAVLRPGPVLLERIGVSVEASENDSFCDEGVDFPGNITLHTFVRHRDEDGAVGNWTFLQLNTDSIGLGATMAVRVAVELRGSGVQVAVLQLDHAGSHCYPWGVLGKLQIQLPGGSDPLMKRAPQATCAYDAGRTETSEGTFHIKGSSSSLRGFVTDWFIHNDTEVCDEKGDNLEKVFFLPDFSPPQVPVCSLDSPPTGPYLDLSFLIHWSYEGGPCNNMNLFDEGIELSLRREGDVLWTPLAFYTRETRIDNQYNISLGYSGGDNVTIRGFSVPVTVNDSDTQHQISLRICSDEIVGEDARPVQFRWLQTAQHYPHGTRDMWSIDDIQVTVSYDPDCYEAVVFFDNFDNNEKLSSLHWPATRRAEVGLDKDICNEDRNGSAVWFGNHTQFSLDSRMIATRPITLQREAVCPTVSNFIPTILFHLDPELAVILNLLYNDVDQGLAELVGYVERNSDIIDETQVIFLTSVVLSIFGDSLVSSDTSKLYVDVASHLITAVSSRITDEAPSSKEGSQLLRNMDQFALLNHNPSSRDIKSPMLDLTVWSEGVSGEEVMVINEASFSLTLPSEVFTNNKSLGKVYASSFFYGNMSGFLDNSLPGNSNSKLLGPVLSSFVHSEDEVLKQSQLSSQVRITFSYPTSGETTPTCVFWNFANNSWDTSGCETERKGESVECLCNHLTHFALLLSPGGVEVSEGEKLSLEIIGIVGVTVSLIFLVITILTFIAFRSLWSLRNYVHIQLCVSLIIAQLVFVIGIEPRGSEAACSAVAVLLHYFWLVTFMWMLMEGAVLYVALVKVFDVHHMKYVFAFTAISYGAPLVYMLVCVPLGLALSGDDGQDHYGYSEACWLRHDTRFIWAFITPVILIILVNIGFFIMATVIMCRHQRTQAHLSRRQQTLHWMKASVSLMIVMGLAWVFGVTIFTETVRPLAYLFTIFVAFQGFVIFIVLVVFSKQVRETYSKWWKNTVVNSEFVTKHFSDWSWSKTSVSNEHSNGKVSPTEVKLRSGTDLSASSGSFLVNSSKASISGTAPSFADPLAEGGSIADPLGNELINSPPTPSSNSQL